MTLSDFTNTLRQHAWPIAFVLVVVAGYSLGKDAALADNAADRHAAEGMVP